MVLTLLCIKGTTQDTQRVHKFKTEVKIFKNCFDDIVRTVEEIPLDFP